MDRIETVELVGEFRSDKTRTSDSILAAGALIIDGRLVPFVKAVPLDAESPPPLERFGVGPIDRRVAFIVARDAAEAPDLGTAVEFLYDTGAGVIQGSAVAMVSLVGGELLPAQVDETPPPPFERVCPFCRSPIE